MEIGKRIPGSRRISHLAVLCLWLHTSAGHPVLSRDHLRVSGAVARQCQSVLSSATQLTPYAAVQDPRFANGDWHQDAGHPPLMQVPPADGSGGPELLQQVTPLATFTLTHVSVQQQRQRSLNVTGVLSLTIRRNCCCSGDKSELMDPHGGRRLSPEFKLDPRVAKLDILLEGVYTETASDTDADGGGGERVLCMVGNALLPMRGGVGNTTGPWDWVENVADGSNFEPPVVADDNIVLILRYPKAQTLTTWAAHGEMMTTRAKSDNVYFDTVRLVSQFGDRHDDASYRFRTETEELAVIAGCRT